MAAAALEQVLRRDRAVVVAALGILSAIAWAYVIWLAGQMDMAGSGGGMAGMEMPGLMEPVLRPWSGSEFLFMFAMWAVMMVGMMTPSVAPMVLVHAQVARQAQTKGSPFASTGWFVAGYLLAWIGFSALATAAQWGLERTALLTPMLASAGTVLGGSLLILAGLYQLTPLKQACLAQCQSPLAFIQRHGGFRRSSSGALRLGLRHGFYCVGCCWALMALLFVGGVMNLLWIGGLAVFVLIEKVLVTSRTATGAAGAALVAAGIWVLAS